MTSGANDRRSIVHRVREARRAYRGPFTCEHIRKVLADAGYEPAHAHEADEFLVFVKHGCRPIPVNPTWKEIWDDDPIFRCLRRDLGFSPGRLRTHLNQARKS